MQTYFLQIFKIFISLLIPMLPGYAAINLLIRKGTIDMPSRLSLSMGAGLGILSQIMLAMGLLKLNFSFLSISSACILLCLVLFCAAFIKKTYSQASEDSGMGTYLPYKRTFPEKTLSTAVLIYTILFLSYILWRSLNIPVYTYDTLHFIALKSKVFFYEKNISDLARINHPSYPLFVSFIQTWIAMTLGGWNDQMIKIIFPVISICFIAIHYSFIKRLTNGVFANIGLLLLLSSPLYILHSTISYRDLCMLYYTCATLMLLILWHKEDKKCFLITAAIFAGFMTFIKLEGQAYFLATVILALMILLQKRSLSVSSKIKNMIIFCVPAIVTITAFLILKSTQNIPTEKIALDISSANIKRFVPIIKAFYEDLFFTGNWGLAWFILIISISFNFMKVFNNNTVKLMFYILTLFFGIYFAEGLFTENFSLIGGHGTKTTLSRVILHFFPVAIWLICMINYEERSISR